MCGVAACAALVGRHASDNPGPDGPAASVRPTTSASDVRPSGATLTVVVTDLRNRKGDLVFGVFRSGEGFPNKEAKAVNWQVKPADPAPGKKSVTFTTHLPPGRYAASVLHDENRSGELNRNFASIPTEGYGVTNNPKPALRAATFNEATFELPASGRELTISIQYFQ